MTKLSKISNQLINLSKKFHPLFPLKYSRLNDTERVSNPTTAHNINTYLQIKNSGINTSNIANTKMKYI